ncbi:hypothetical protein FGO68_gene10348 [Halteria grandinella]|uniref:Uncharacterized protein n=1 Tax=Halteria grandinella TaxID=5974 RepID=A0A8J8T628_HALGN|nr:hypothetical protein FGO68_gene10348 [Halteria grandinella]
MNTQLQRQPFSQVQAQTPKLNGSQQIRFFRKQSPPQMGHQRNSSLSQKLSNILQSKPATDERDLENMFGVSQGDTLGKNNGLPNTFGNGDLKKAVENTNSSGRRRQQSPGTRTLMGDSFGLRRTSAERAGQQRIDIKRKSINKGKNLKSIDGSGDLNHLSGPSINQNLTTNSGSTRPAIQSQSTTNLTSKAIMQHFANHQRRKSPLFHVSQSTGGLQILDQQQQLEYIGGGIGTSMFHIGAGGEVSNSSIEMVRKNNSQQVIDQAQSRNGLQKGSNSHGLLRQILESQPQRQSPLRVAQLPNGLLSDTSVTLAKSHNQSNINKTDSFFLRRRQPMASNPYQETSQGQIAKDGKSCLQIMIEEAPSSMINMSCCPNGLLNTYQQTQEQHQTTDADEQPSLDSQTHASLAMPSSRPQINIKCFQNEFMRGKGMWPEQKTHSAIQTAQSQGYTQQSQASAQSMGKRADAMYKLYMVEKEKHLATKQVLDKAIDLASHLLQEIQKIERNSSPSQVFRQRSLFSTNNQPTSASSLSQHHDHHLSHQNPLSLTLENIQSQRTNSRLSAYSNAKPFQKNNGLSSSTQENPLCTPSSSIGAINQSGIQKRGMPNNGSELQVLTQMLRQGVSTSNTGKSRANQKVDREYQSSM